MFDRIKKIFGSRDELQKDERHSSPASEPDKLEHIWVKMNPEKYEDVIAEARKYFSSANPKLVYEAKKLTGLAYFRTKRYSDSEKIFEDICITSDNQDDFFNLTTAATMNGNFIKGEEAVEKAISLVHKNGISSGISIPNIRLYYMAALKDMQQWDRAYQQLQNLGEIYMKFCITDSTFLYIRGVPFIEHTMDASKEILENISGEKAKQFMKILISGVDDGGKRYLGDFEKNLHYAL